MYCKFCIAKMTKIAHIFWTQILIRDRAKFKCMVDFVDVLQRSGHRAVDSIFMNKVE